MRKLLKGFTVFLLTLGIIGASGSTASASSFNEDDYVLDPTMPIYGKCSITIDANKARKNIEYYKDATGKCSKDVYGGFVYVGDKSKLSPILDLGWFSNYKPVDGETVIADGKKGYYKLKVHIKGKYTKVSKKENEMYRRNMFDRFYVKKSDIEKPKPTKPKPKPTPKPEKPKKVDGFIDVKKGHAHYDGIMSMYKEKVINGYPYKDGINYEYRPYENISRVHTALILFKAFDLEVTYPPVYESFDALKDVTEDMDYGEIMATVHQEGIFKGSNGYFMPYKNLTREQMATVLVNAYDLEESKNHVAVNLDNVDPSHKGNVQILADNGITNQLDDYRPREAVNRGQFATFLYNINKNK